MENQIAQLRVLLADDDEDDRTFFTDALQEIKLNTALRAVGDGVELIRALLPRTVELPHLIFLDLNMPGKGGMECLQEIRMMSHLHTVPVIIFSTSANHTDIEETFRRGANLYLQKPSGFGMMVNLLEKVLQIDWNEHMKISDRKKYLFS